MKFQIHLNKFLFGIILLFSGILNAQEELQVTRCLAAEFRRPVVNVFSDESNNIWASDGKNLYQIQAADLATPVKLNAGEQSILNFPGGNQDFRFQQEALDAVLGADFGAISAAFYDQQRQELWIGTTEGGVFQIKANSGLKLLNNYNNKNSKLKSNHINTILVDQTGETWIGTKEGMFVGKGSRWTLEEKLFSFDRVVERGSTVWILGDDFLWKVNSRGDWNPVDLDVRQLEGLIRDFTIDPQGQLWIASEIITRYDPDTEEYRKFGPIEYYTSQYATNLVVDGAGAVWIGTEDKGVYLIGKASGMAVSCLVAKELSCDSDKNDAALEVKISGGEAPYTYAWSNGLKGENPQNLGPGEYAVTVTDSKGKSRVAQAMIENSRFTVEVKQDKEESLPSASDGVASVTIAGNASNFKFQWDNGETTQKATKLNTGNHSVTVTDQKGCSATGTVTISQGVAAMAINIEQISAIKCTESNDAALKVSITGGKAPFQYKWSDSKLVGAQPTNIAPGSYQLQVIDAAGNSESAIISIKAPEALSASIQVQSPASTGNSDGKAIVNAKGGNGNYTFKWDNGETTQTATKLAPGKHDVTITDINGCFTMASVEIKENILPLAIALNETNSIKCNGNADAAVTVQVSGGKAPFQYLWNDTKLNGENPKGLTAGNYQITVTDAAGNKANANISIKAPEALSASIQVQSPASTGNSDGKAIVNAKGGNGNFTFKWDNGETTQTATKLAPGKHDVTITDINGCTTTASMEITENILPLAIALNETNSIKCNGNADAAIAVQVSGGKAPFQYLWNDTKLNGENPKGLTAGDYQITVTDAAGNKANANISIKAPEALSASIQVQSPASTGNSDGKAIVNAKGGNGNFTFKWDNGETTQTATKLAPGKHNVTITDINGCITTASVEIMENILPLVVAIKEINSIKCSGNADAALTVEVSGGKAPFQYLWNDTKLNGENPKGLAAGNYQITVTDAAGNKANANISIKAPEALSASIQVQSPASTGNSDGKAIVNAKGGNGNFTFKWDNGETTQTASKLAPGKHNVTITDINGCITTASVEIMENILPLVVAIKEINSIKCSGNADAALTVEVSGGKAPFQYQWNESSLTGNQVSNLKPGDYNVSVTDALGTTKSANIKIAEPALLAAEITKKRGATTEATKDGKATVEAKGGAGNYTFKWDNGETTAEAKQLPMGIHNVTVSDANGCQTTTSVEITKRILPTLTLDMLKTGEAIRMEQLQFDADSTTINEPSMPVLNELFDFLTDNPAIVVEIGGHTNSLPPDDYCDRISTERAQAVSNYLVGKGIDPKRLYAKGYGKRKPIASNDTADGRRRNQRVEIRILELNDGG